MNFPCNKCGGSGKVHVWYHGLKTRQLKTCPVCKGVGWFAEVTNDHTVDMNGRRIRT